MPGLLITCTVGCLLIAYRYIRSGLDQAVVSAERIAEGDLIHEFDTSRNDEIGQLLQAVGHINGGVADMIGNIRGSTDQMTVAASEIASGNADLSARTESQASSLEETASAMETLTETVQQNAANASQANQLTTEAATVAAQGGAVVAQAVSTMASIKDCSARITDIISVIDGIAFQTNILALNAAVDAMRSCVMPVQALAGKRITTIEGLASTHGPALQQAWIEHQVPQCGYCQSGMLMAAAALLATHAHPTDAQIDAAMTNLCRCGTYPRVRAAIHSAATAGNKAKP
ncbi:MAG: 2Fe-2S iron-sulfur cluster-binding protein [Pseudomonadota bacterium]